MEGFVWRVLDGASRPQMTKWGSSIARLSRRPAPGDSDCCTVRLKWTVPSLPIGREEEFLIASGTAQMAT
jgi:hypothetical protein